MAPLTTVTSSGILDGTIVNADVNASAAIAGTKIAPDFGSQTVTTTGAIDANGAVIVTQDNAVHLNATSGDDLDALLRESSGNAVLINSRNDAILNIDSNNDSSDAHFAVAHGAATSSSTELFRVQENGNVGIGTTSPGTLLDCEIAASDKLEYGGNPRLFLQCATGNNGLRIYADTSPLEVRADNTSRYFYINGSPSYDTTWAGKTCTSGSTFDSSPKLYLNGTRWTGSASATSFQTSIQAVANSATNNDGYLGLGSSATPDDLVIKTDGNVGIGTTSPATKVQIHGGDETLFISGDTAATSAANTGGILAMGGIYHTDGSITGWAQIKGLKDNNTSNSYAGYLALTTRSEGSGYTERMRIDSIGRLLIGDTTTAWNANSDGYKVSIKESTNENGAIMFLDTDSMVGGVAGIAKGTNQIVSGTLNVDGVFGSTYNHTHLISGDGSNSANASIKLTVHTEGNVEILDGNLIVASGHGIDFTATSDGSGTTSSELLDDYEEGTFTPVVSGDGGTAGTWSSNNHTGAYRKVGSLVYIAIQVSGSVSAAGNGNLQITGLPFTSATVTGGHGVALALGPLFNWDIADTAYQIGGRVNDNSTVIHFWNNFDNAADSRLAWCFGSSGTKYGSIAGCYIST